MVRQLFDQAPLRRDYPSDSFLAENLKHLAAMLTDPRARSNDIKLAARDVVLRASYAGSEQQRQRAKQLLARATVANVTAEERAYMISRYLNMVALVGRRLKG